MRSVLCVGAHLVVSVLGSACASGPNEVRSSSYDHTCSADAECVLVHELYVDDRSRCEMGCGDEGIVSTRVASQYQQDLDANVKECDGRMPGLDCAPRKIVARCVQSKCTRVDEQ